MIRINYTGKSKVIRRLCEAVTYLSEHGSGDMLKADYDKDADGIVDNAAMVNNHNVYKDVPADAQFTDTIYDDSYVRGRVVANSHNIELLMSVLFDSDVHVLKDSSGHILVDSTGCPLYSAQHTSKFAQMQKDIEDLKKGAKV